MKYDANPNKKLKFFIRIRLKIKLQFKPTVLMHILLVNCLPASCFERTRKRIKNTVYENVIWFVVQNLRIALSRVFISFEAFLLLYFYYRIICIIDNGASRYRTRNARFRARRADHSTTSMCFSAFRLTLIKNDRQNREHRKGRVFIKGAEL